MKVWEKIFFSFIFIQLIIGIAGCVLMTAGLSSDRKALEVIGIAMLVVCAVCLGAGLIFSHYFMPGVSAAVLELR